MYYQILIPPTAAADKQADELGRLTKHCRQLTTQFVTVAGAYKPVRARLTLLHAPDRLAEPAARVLGLLAGRDDAVKPSAPLRRRPEWRCHALLLPTRPDAPALDGALLDGFDSACLTVVYRPGRVCAHLVYCPEDGERAKRLAPDGWQLISAPNPLQRLAAAGGRPWAGTPSLMPVPGGLAPAQAVPPAAALPVARLPPEALTSDPSGLALGVTPTGAVVRLARRAQTLAVAGRPPAQRHALLALLRQAGRSGMGIVVAADRALLPEHELLELDARVRWLDVQNIAESAAIPWRAIDPGLLAQALGGELAMPPPPTARFGEVLDALGASGLRVPGVLGLTAPPGDDLCGALAAGGLVIIPQDGDAASAAVARLLLAYLAAPPFSARALLLVLDPALVPPAPLRNCAVQVVMGERNDALLSLAAGEAAWQLRDAAGVCVAELLPDLLAIPGADAEPLIEAIVRGVGLEPQASTPQSTPAQEWWDTGLAAQGWEADQPLDVAGQRLPLAQADFVEQEATIAAEQAHAGGHDLDAPLDQLLQWLLLETAASPDAQSIHELIARGEYDLAEQLASAWSDRAPAMPQPWLWRVVLAADDADRTMAARRALQLGPGEPIGQLLRGLLAQLPAPSGGSDLPADNHQQPVEALLIAGHPAATAPALAPLATAPAPLPPHAPEQTMLDDAAIRAAWHAGEALPQLVARLVALGLAAPTARARVRAIIGGRAPASAIAISATGTPIMPGSMSATGTPIMPEAMNGTLVAIMPEEPLAEPGYRTVPLVPSSGPIAHVPEHWHPDALAATAQTTADAMNGTTTALMPESMSATTTALMPESMSATTMPLMPESMNATGTALMPESMNTLSTKFSGMLRNEERRCHAERSEASRRQIIEIFRFAQYDNEIRGNFVDNVMNSTTTAPMPSTSVDDMIWRGWCAHEPTDTLVQLLSGRRGGPKADAARDHIYATVIPRIVAQLGAADLVDRLVRGMAVTHDPRYPELLRRLARSEMPPAGMLERALVRRLITIWTER